MPASDTAITTSSRIPPQARHTLLFLVLSCCTKQAKIRPLTSDALGYNTQIRHHTSSVYSGMEIVLRCRYKSITRLIYHTDWLPASYTAEPRISAQPARHKPSNGKCSVILAYRKHDYCMFFETTKYIQIRARTVHDNQSTPHGRTDTRSCQPQRSLSNCQSNRGQKAFSTQHRFRRNARPQNRAILRAHFIDWR